MNRSIDQVGHLVRRLVGSLSRREPDAADVTWVDAQLLDTESQLWHRMSAADRRHSIGVARRFEALGPWSREEVAGALLHDVGKLDAGLGTVARVAATIVGPRTTRFRRYHDHEPIGAELLAAAGSSPITIELVVGRGPAAPALSEADNI
jgi:hypothetical protein